MGIKFVDTIKFADQLTLWWGDYPSWPNLITRILKTRRRRSQQEGQRDSTQKRLNSPSLALEMDSGQEPRNAGSLLKLENRRKWIVS